MPELPEVESIKLQLQKYLVGHKIINIEIRNPKYELEKDKVLNAKIKSIRRFAKVLAIDLSSGYSIVIHIKLTGQLIYRGPNLPKVSTISQKVTGGVPGKHTHVIFKLDHGGFLYYNDVRRFGWIKVIKTAEVETSGFVGKLGPEPFGSAQGKPFTYEYFQGVLAKTKRAVKVVLMDQSKMGGVGNIYANDALWLTGVSRNKESKKLGNEEIKKLYGAIHQVLKEGVKYGGASELAFVTPDGQEGSYQNYTLAYGKEGTLCPRPACRQIGVKFTKYFLSGRGTYVCPNCQV